MNGTDLEDYSDLVISRSISNLGIGGICVTSCAFKTRDVMETYGQCATVAIGGGVGNVPLFYINKRTYSDGVWTVEALDRCAFLDRRIVTTGWQQIQPATPTDTLSYDTATFISAMIEQCGLGNDSAIPYTETKIPCDLIDGQTYQSVLSSMALAYCGFFYCPSDTNVLTFMSYSSSGTSQLTLDAYSRIHDNGSYSYNSIKVTNGSKSVTYDGGSLEGGVPCLEINNNFAKADGSQAASAIYEGLRGRSFKGWSVDKAACTSLSVPNVGDPILIGGTSYRLTRVEARFVGSKMMLSMGQDIPQMGEIERRGLLQQKLDEAISTQKTYKWLRPTYQDPFMVPTEATEKGASS